MIKYILSAMIALFLATPAIAQPQPNWSGHMVVGGKIGKLRGEQSVYGIDFSGSSDPLGDFDLKLDTILSVTPNTKHVYMNAKINPKIAGRFKKIIQRYTFTSESFDLAMIVVHTDQANQAYGVHVRSSAPVVLYRTSMDGGVTWSGIREDTSR